MSYLPKRIGKSSPIYFRIKLIGTKIALFIQPIFLNQLYIYPVLISLHDIIINIISIITVYNFNSVYCHKTPYFDNNFANSFFKLVILPFLKSSSVTIIFIFSIICLFSLASITLLSQSTSSKDLFPR